MQCTRNQWMGDWDPGDGNDLLGSLVPYEDHRWWSLIWTLHGFFFFVVAFPFLPYRKVIDTKSIEPDIFLFSPLPATILIKSMCSLGVDIWWASNLKDGTFRRIWAVKYAHFPLKRWRLQCVCVLTSAIEDSFLIFVFGSTGQVGPVPAELTHWLMQLFNQWFSPWSIFQFKR